MRNRGVTKNQEIIGWLQILIKILFNEIAAKMHIICPTRFRVTCFFNIVAPEGGHKNIAEVLSEIHDPLI